MALVRSLLFSLLASLLATVALRRILSVAPSTGEDSGGGMPAVRSYVVVVPIITGNSSNRIGWVKEEHQHYRPLFGFGGR